MHEVRSLSADCEAADEGRGGAGRVVQHLYSPDFLESMHAVNRAMNLSQASRQKQFCPAPIPRLAQAYPEQSGRLVHRFFQPLS
jgi:hypothetical protein